MQLCVIAYVSGLVQGVGFRYFTRQQALKLNLTGYAHNMDDGRVEVMMCGETVQVKKLIDWLKNEGPKTARITQVITEPRPLKEWIGFKSN